MAKDRSEGGTMSDDTRITADLPSEDTHICLTPLPRGEVTQPKPSRQFWKWNQAIDRLLKPSRTCQPKREHQFWRWFRWMGFILCLATVSISVATCRQQARNRQSLIEIQRNQAEIQRNQAKIDELKKEADRLEQELLHRKREAQRAQ